MREHVDRTLPPRRHHKKLEVASGIGLLFRSAFPPGYVRDSWSRCRSHRTRFGRIALFLCCRRKTVILFCLPALQIVAIRSAYMSASCPTNWDTLPTCAVLRNCTKYTSCQQVALMNVLVIHAILAGVAGHSPRGSVVCSQNRNGS